MNLPDVKFKPWQTTLASDAVNASLHTVPHALLMQTSILPSKE